MTAPSQQGALTLPATAATDKPARHWPHRGVASTAASRDDWQTPAELMDGLRGRWHFVLDAACSLGNALAQRGLTAECDALSVPWADEYAVTTQMHPAHYDGGHRAVWCNPPYGRKGQLARAFAARGMHEAAETCGPMGADVVMLLPATPAARWMHDAVLGGPYPASEVWFTRGRLSFVHPVSGLPMHGNPVGSVLVVWRAGWRAPGGPLVGSIGRDGEPAGGW